MAVSTLTPMNKERYVKWHKENAEQDLKDAKNMIKVSEKWAIITGYYAMHNAAKYYLGKVRNKKIEQPEAHADTIKEIEVALRQKYKTVAQLIEQAKEEFDSLTNADQEDIKLRLIQGREKMEKRTYYQTHPTKPEEAIKFIEETVKPFIKIIMELEE